MSAAIPVPPEGRASARPPTEQEPEPDPVRTIADVDPSFAEAFVHKQPPASFRSLACHAVARRRWVTDHRSLPSGHSVLGMPLIPFSRWHAANLDFIGSPFAGHIRAVRKGLLNIVSASFAELWLAAQCCQLQFPQTLNSFSSVSCVSWAKRIRAERRFLRSPQQSLAAFTAYLHDYSSKPELVVSEEAEPVKTPWYFFEVCALLHARCVTTRAEAWDLSIGEGSWLLAGIAEATGAKIDILSTEDKKQLAELGIS